ncbi:MAG: hypothetical protein PHW83_10745 [Bacteroidales bacterium]|nr:hypothetical protein [Bacteroidales bacterium]
MIEKLKKLAEMQNQLAIQAYSAYLPLVDDIIKSKQTDLMQIERTLDGLLDFCFDPKMLMLYRRLCRYLYDIDKESTAYYVNAYQEMWDEEGKLFGNKNEKENME